MDLAFVSARSEASGQSFFVPSDSTFDPVFESILDSFAFDTDRPMTLQLHGLDIGMAYQIQLFVSDNRQGIGDRRGQFFSDHPDPAAPEANRSDTALQLPAHHVVGHFTADAPSQTIYAHGIDHAPCIMNAYILRRLGSEPLGPAPAELDGIGYADLNQNGYPDLKELIDPLLAQFPAGEDSDLDGYSNQAESLAGTDPFDETSSPMSAQLSLASLSAAGVKTTSGSETNSVLAFRFRSVPGVRYAVEYTPALNEPWEVATPSFMATEALSSLLYEESSLSPTGLFRGMLRAKVLPSLDSDHDGLEDALERYLGFDPERPDSVRSLASGGDRAQLMELMQGATPSGGLFNRNESGAPSGAQITRFLSQAAFGPSPQTIAELQALGTNAFEKWIDQQLLVPASMVMPYLENVLEASADAADFSEQTYYNPNVPYGVLKGKDFVVEQANYRTALCRLALFAPDQARQRMVSALSRILVSDPVGGLGARNLGSFRDVLSTHAFGNYENLLYEISVNPSMATYLSFLGNRQAKPSINRMPDENYAREIMQLFSIGLYELHPDGSFRLDPEGNRIETYTNEDVVQLARVFTGLDFEFGAHTGGFYDRWSHHPLTMYEDRHDTGDDTSLAVYGFREKRILNGPFYQPPALPAFEDDPGRDGLDDIRDACRILVNHPNCPPFISKLLIQHLVTSNPSPAYVGRVAAVFSEDGNGVRGNLAAVYKAILLDPEARSLQTQFSPIHGKLKGGVLRTTTLAKAFEAGIATPTLHGLDGVQMIRSFTDLRNSGETFGEDFPSVFSFYLPEYAHPGPLADKGLLSPEFQAFNAQRAVLLPNLVWTGLSEGFDLRQEGGAPSFAPDLESLETLLDTPDALIDHLNQLLCHGTLGARSRDIIRAALFNTDGLPPLDRTRLAVYLTHTSPEATVLR